VSSTIGSFDYRSSGRVITLALHSGPRLIYMNNLKVQPFIRYDMPEKYDLARKCPLLSSSRSYALIPNLASRRPSLHFNTIPRHPQHSKRATYTFIRPTTRRSVPGSSSRIPSTPPTRQTSNLLPLPPMSSSVLPCAPIRRYFSSTGTVTRARCRRACGTTRLLRPACAQTSSRLTTAASATRRARRARPD